MILVDTSVWVRHLREGNRALSLLLEQDRVLTHPFVLGELACGSMANRREVLGLLGTLPCASLAEHSEVLHLVEQEHLYGQGIGWIDAHLLASALISRSGLYTSDAPLRRAAESLGIAYGIARRGRTVNP
jgi:predicted nucleic acid-binding protein